MPSNSATSSAIVIGANGGLGYALCKQWLQDDNIDQIIAVSRQCGNLYPQKDNNEMHHLQCDYNEHSITHVCKAIKKLAGTITRVCICNGVLHNDKIWPEKRIEELDSHTLQEVFNINSVIPLLWLKALLPLVKGHSDCVITVFSARIGSISDNRSGGWYSYRASKAALNMLLKTAAIEFSRRAKNVKLIAFQPGTTNTNLSKPFQASVKQEDLLSPEFVASQLVEIMNHQSADGELSFIDWENKAIAW